MAVRNPQPLSAESVSGSSLASESVSAGKIAKPAAAPAKGAEKAVVVSAVSTTKGVIATVTGDAAKTEWAVTHNLGSKNLVVQGYSPEAEPALIALEKITAKTENEAVIKTTAALGAGVAGYFNIIAL